LDAAPHILAYAADDVTTRRSRAWRIAWTVSTLPAAVVPVLDFYWSVSPLDVWREFVERGFDAEWMIVCAGLTFFVAYPLIAWRLRLALGRRPGIRESRAAFVAAMLSAGGPVTMIVVAIWHIADGSAVEAILLFGTLGGGLVLGGVIAWRCRRHVPAAADALMLGTYLANASFCIYAFRDDPQIGYWLSVAACAIFLPQLVLLPLATRRRRYVL
jgi:hypothetical protein